MLGCKRRAYVFKRPEEKMIPHCIVPTVKHGGRLITVWGCIGANSVGDLIKIKGILKKEQYLSILRDHAIPSAINRPKFCFLTWQRSQARCKGLQRLFSTFRTEWWIKNNALAPSIGRFEPNREDLGWIRSENPWSVSKVPKLLLEQTIKCMKPNSTRIETLIKRMLKLVERIIKKRGGYIDEKKI